MEEEKKEDKEEESSSEDDNLGGETVESPEIEETEKVTDKKTKKETKQLKKIFFILGMFVLFFVGIFSAINSTKSFDYEGVHFDVVKEGELILYTTYLPVNSRLKLTGAAVFTNYNFYLRNDPRRLENLPIEGELTLMKNVVINFTEDFKCEGDGIIAVANVINVLEVLDVKAIKNETAVCDSEGRYTFLQLQSGDETSIEQFGPSCYNLNINNCEVLEVTEKYIVRLLSEVNKNRL